MKKVLQIGRDVKARRKKVEEILEVSLDDLEIDTRLELIQELIPLGLLHVKDALEEEVRTLAGKRYKRNGLPGYNRWGKQWGSVYLGEHKLPMVYQRIRDIKEDKEVMLKSYKQLQEPKKVDERLLKRILLGLSCRRYRECSEAIPPVFGLSSSAVSRRFISASKRKLAEMTDRRLDDLDIVAIILDGKGFQDDEMIVALGITMEGKKVILGFIQSGTENKRVCKDFLNTLLNRGLKIDEGILCVMDGSKGLSAAVSEAFEGYALIQRCS